MTSLSAAALRPDPPLEGEIIPPRAPHTGAGSGPRPRGWEEAPARPDPAERARLLERLRRIDTAASWMDARFGIPGTRLRFGLDGLLGLIPGVGDAAGLAVSAWILAEAREAGASWPLIARMGLNVALDAIIGAVPLLGDLFDFAFKANRMNAQLLREHLHREGRL